MRIQTKEVLNSISPYIPGKPIEEVQRELGLKHVIKLASNENPLGCSPKAKEAILDVLKNPGLYPDSNCTVLRNTLARKMNLEPCQFFFGAGSDGIIEMIPRAFINPGDEAIMATPSFSLYETHTKVEGGVCIQVPLDENYCFNLNAMAEKINPKTKIIWLCNPNNPTGTMYSAEAQNNFLKKVPANVLVVLDEAYYEYVDAEDYPESVGLLKQYDNIIILRTFSKIYGLASARIGYAISNPEIISALEKVKSPFNVSSYAQAAAAASLEDDDFKEKSFSFNRQNKEFLYAAFKNMGLRYLPSQTNFIMVDVGKDSRKIFEDLLKKGVIVRPGYLFGMDTWLRVTIGTMEECKKFLQVLSSVV